MPIQATFSLANGTSGAFSVVTAFHYDGIRGEASATITTWLDQDHYTNGDPPITSSVYDIFSLITPDFIASIEQTIIAVPSVAALSPVQVAPVQIANPSPPVGAKI